METIPVAGVDVSKRFSDLCILAPDNQVFAATKVGHDEPSLSQALALLQQAERRFGLKPAVVMESTSHYHLIVHQYLSKAGFEVIVVNPLQSHALRNINVRKMKNDRVDAKRLALLYRTTVLRQSQIPQDAARGLRLLTRQRAELVKDLTRYRNQLTALLDQIFPDYDKVFSDMSGKSSVAVLTAYLTPRRILEATPDQLTQLIASASRRGRNYSVQKAEKLQAVAQSAVCLGLESAGDRAAIASVLQILCALQKSLELLEQEIAQLVDDNVALRNNVELLQTIPGIGFWIAAVLIAEMGDFSAFRRPKQLAAYWGLDPSEHQSGTFRGTKNKMSKRGSPYARAMLHMAAHNAVHSLRGRPPLNPVLAEYYEKKRSEKPAKVAIGAVMHKLTNIIFAVLRDGQPFELRQPASHAASLGMKAA